MENTDFFSDTDLNTELVLNNRLIKAIKKIKKSAEAAGLFDLSAKLDYEYDTYGYLLKFFIDDIDDPQRKKILNSLKRSLLHINDNIRRQKWLNKAFSEFQNFSENQELDFDIAEDDEISKNRLFMKLWSCTELSEKDHEKLNDFFIDENKDWVLKSLVVSALTLNLLIAFDERKIELIIDLIISGQKHIAERALIGLLFIMLIYDNRIKLYPKIEKKLKKISNIPNFSEKVNVAILQIIRSAKETEVLKERFEQEILPEMDKLRPNISQKLDIDKLMSENMFDEENPEWEKIFEGQEDLFNKMQEFSMLQLEGADIMHATFSKMKYFPFFQLASNWLLPFYKDNVLLRRFFASIGFENESTDNFINILEKVRYMCNSDKYSFCYQFSFMPEMQRKSVVDLFKMEAESVNEVQDSDTLNDTLGETRHIIIRYVQDLYRFFKLYHGVKTIPDIFDMDLNFHDKYFFALITKDSEKITRKIAEFYFAKKFYFEAVEIFEFLKNKKPQSEILEKLGFAYQKLKDYENALKCYKEAELFDGNKKWLNKKIAFASMKLGLYEQALEYYMKVKNEEKENLKLLVNIGNCYLNIEKYEEALKYYFQVDYYSEGNVKVTRAIAFISLKINKLKQAEKYYEKTLGLSPRPDDFIMTGHIYWIEKQKNKAYETYKKAFKYYENNEDFYDDFIEEKEILTKNGIDDFEISLMIDAVLKEE